MSVYQPQWQGWTPNPPSPLPDLPDKSPPKAPNTPFVGFVGLSPGHFQGGSTDHLKLGGKSQNPEKTLWEEPDIPDKSPPGTRIVLLAVPDGAPEGWVQGVGELMVMPPHPAWTEDGWKTLQGDALRFIREWANQAHRLGWDALDLFGVHRTKPTARLDCMALVPLLKGRPVLALTDDSAAVKTASGGTLTFRRRGTPPVALCLVWKLAGTAEGGSQ